jgi:alkanesulfonate monooxygenase SsuD/methylene tetrahydromethanopterin reductase-like flavin-dependent oxidoreductase (luciferase family)
VIRDDANAAEAAARPIFAANGVENAGDVPHLFGSPAAVADAIRPYGELGFETVIVRLPAPYDRETIDRMPEVAALLG